MHNKLQGRTNKLKLRKQPAKQPTIKKHKRTINIYKISYLAFYINLKRFKNTLFLLSLYELDRELEDRKRGQKQELKAKELNLIS
jgi:MFS superfamily sulfate permease-like transporter